MKNSYIVDYAHRQTRPTQKQLILAGFDMAIQVLAMLTFLTIALGIIFAFV